MKSYRIYLVGQDGRLQLGAAFEAADDEAALSRAVDLADGGYSTELWSGGRLVGRVARDGRFSPGDN